MKTKNVQGIIFLVIFSLFATQAWSANTINSASNYSIIIAVTINKDDHIMGKLEYSNNSMQLVTFNPIAGNQSLYAIGTK